MIKTGDTMMKKAKITQRLLALLLMVSLIAAPFPLSAMAAPDGPQGLLTPSATTVAEGRDFTLALSVSGAGAYTALSATVSYNAEKFEYKGFIEPEGPNWIVDVSPAASGENGALRVTRFGYAAGAPDPVADGATAVALTFTAKAVGADTAFTATDVKASKAGAYEAVEAADASADVTVTAAAGEFYSITVDPAIENGTVTASAASAAAGDVVALTVTEDPGYALVADSLEVNGGAVTVSGNGTAYTFTMPAEETTVTAAFALQAVDLTIGTAEELASFRDAVNDGTDSFEGKLVKLSADIDLSEYHDWVPIGTHQRPFKGTFDGGGKTVTLGIDLVSYYAEPHMLAGLFGYAEYAEFKNLTTDGYIRHRVESGSAPEVAAIVIDAFRVRLVNCVNSADITVGQAGSSVAGLVGNLAVVRNLAPDPDATFTGSREEYLRYGLFSCRNSGNITYDGGGVRTGGLAGQVGGSIYRCENSGDIVVASEGAPVYAVVQYVGGLTAGIVGRSADIRAKIAESFNSGNIVTCGMQAGGLTAAGGQADIIDSYNTGNVINLSYSNRGVTVSVAGIYGGHTATAAVSNCYTAGTISAFAGEYTHIDEIAIRDWDGGAPAVSNSFGRGQPFTAASLGPAFKDDVNSINGGYPLLAWQSATAPDDAYPVTFNLTPPQADVKVYSDSARQNEILVSGGLTAGTYFYTASCAGYLPESGSFKVAQKAVTVGVALKRAAEVTFTVAPASAALEVSQGGNAVAAASASGGTYVYALAADTLYEYTASAQDYSSTTREFIAEDGRNIAVSLTPSAQADKPWPADNRITEGGVYTIPADVAGLSRLVVIGTDEPVTLAGHGVGEDAGAKYRTVYVKGEGKTGAGGIDLTLKDVYISITDASPDVLAHSTIEIIGTGNSLRFEGTNILDRNTSYGDSRAMVHVPDGAGVSIGGGADDSLYLYKYNSGSGIGGDAGEYNGEVTFTGGSVFGKSSKQGALVGSGADSSGASGSPGDIKIYGGSLTLLPISSAAAIGGGAGGGAGAKGADVYIYGGTVTFNVDFSGAAIGGAGYNGGKPGNDSDGGTLYYRGGSIRTFIDYNAVDPNGDGDFSDSIFGAAGYGVDDAAITAYKCDGDIDNEVFLAALDTSLLETGADSFTVFDGGENGVRIYDGGLHLWKFINEDLQKSAQIAVSYTIDNWVPLSDPNLYLYLTAGNHALTVNGEAFTAAWDAETETFTVTADTGGTGEPKPGDADGDGDVTVGDALFAAGAVLGARSLTAAQITAADMDGDGFITMKDVILIARKAAGL
jgi:hypothetical protein